MLFENNTIKIDKVPNVLDDLVLEFTEILGKYYKYVIISGYVTILLGRTRATEDIDVLIEKRNGEIFSELWKALLENGFYCLNTENMNEALSYLEEGLAIRFAKTDTVIPNFEVKFPKNELEHQALKERIKVELPKGIIFIPKIEQQIAVKRILLASEKDVEDAIYLEELFKGKLNKEKLNHYIELCKKLKEK